MLPHVSDFQITKWGPLGASGVEGLPQLGDPALTAALLQQGAHYTGHLALSQGAILTGLVWGAIVASLIDGNFKVAGGFTLAGAAMYVALAMALHGAALRIMGFVDSMLLPMRLYQLAAIAGLLALSWLAARALSPRWTGWLSRSGISGCRR